jgi:zinc transport system substrate-binding protein
VFEQEAEVITRTRTRPGCIAALALLAATSVALRPGAAQALGSDAGIAAFCSIEPQRFIVERVGGTNVAVEVLVAPGQSPHTFEPTPRQMARLAGAEVYFAIGLPFEEMVLDGIKELSADLLVVATADSVPKREIEEAHGTHDGHDHEGDGTHDEHAGLPDPHVWLSPRHAALLAEATCRALQNLDPFNGREYEDNLAELRRELDDLDVELTEALAPLAGESVYVFHPAFGYFTDAYGLVQVPVETGGMEPGARELVDLVEGARADSVRVIFVQPQFSSKSAEAVAAEIGGAVVPIDPLSGDYIENLRNIAEEVRRALASE